MIEQISLYSIDDNPYQVRELYPGVEEIAASLAELRAIRDDDKKGLIHVPLGRRVGNRVQLADGHSRYRAFCRLNETEPTRWGFMPVDIGERSDIEMATIAASENSKRDDLKWPEIATGINRFMSEFEMTQAEAGALFGLNSQAAAANYLRALRIIEELGNESILNAAWRGEFGVAHALKLGPLYREDREALTQLLATGQHFESDGSIKSAKEIERLIRRSLPAKEQDVTYQPGEVTEIAGHEFDLRAWSNMSKNFAYISNHRLILDMPSGKLRASDAPQVYRLAVEALSERTESFIVLHTWVYAHDRLTVTWYYRDGEPVYLSNDELDAIDQPVLAVTMILDKDECRHLPPIAEQIDEFRRDEAERARRREAEKARKNEEKASLPPDLVSYAVCRLTNAGEEIVGELRADLSKQDGWISKKPFYERLEFAAKEDPVTGPERYGVHFAFRHGGLLMFETGYVEWVGKTTYSYNDLQLDILMQDDEVQVGSIFETKIDEIYIVDVDQRLLDDLRAQGVEVERLRQLAEVNRMISAAAQIESSVDPGETVEILADGTQIRLYKNGAYSFTPDDRDYAEMS